MARPTIIDGSCHCGNISYTLHWPSFAGEIPVRECGCSFCRKHGGAWTSNRDSKLEVEIREQSHVSEYQFGTATAEFLICARCGVAPLVTSNIDGTLYAVVNTNTFDSQEPLSFSRSSANFDGEEVSSRLARRKRNWIPDVKFSRTGG